VEDAHAETKDQPDEQREPLTPLCASCGGAAAWESVTDGWGERWLAVCACGRIDSFFPDRRHPDQRPGEPLTMFLQGHVAPRPPATPAWVRLFLRSLEEPWLVRWRYCPSGCPRCQTTVSYAFQACPRPSYQAICTLCLGCGYATATYHPWQGPTEPPVTGATWTPACPAVQRLRDCIYRPYPAPVGRVNPAG
jgi:hypothetical protein